MRIIFVLFLLLSGCSTAYQKQGFTGGYTDMTLGKDTFKVSFKGNGYTSKDTVHNYFLRRCSEITVENGYDYFAFIDQSSDVSMSAMANSYSTGYNTNTNVTLISKHEREGIIKLFKEGTQPNSALEAKAILKNFEK